jgi:hypothetical protein
MYGCGQVSPPLYFVSERPRRIVMAYSLSRSGVNRRFRWLGVRSSPAIIHPDGLTLYHFVPQRALPVWDLSAWAADGGRH